eukprot:gene16739-23010_t
MTIRVRRAEAQDVPDVDNLCAQLHGHDEVGSMLLETALLTFVAVDDAEDQVVGFLCVDSLCTPRMDSQADTQEWMEGTSQVQKANIVSTAYVKACAVHPNHELDACSLLLRAAMIAAPAIERIYLGTSEDITFREPGLAAVFDRTQSSRSPAAYLYEAKREAVLPPLLIRRACVEDHDDMLPILTSAEERLPALAKLPESSRPEEAFALTRVVAGQGSIVGFMVLTAEVETSTLSDAFDLHPYDNFLPVKEYERRQEAATLSLMEVKMGEARKELLRTQRSKKKREPTEEGEEEREESEEGDEDSAGGGEGEAEGDGGEGEERLADVEVDLSSVLPPTEEEVKEEMTRMFSGGGADGPCNIFAITMLCLEEPYEHQALDFMSQTFDMFSNREYCVLTLPHSSPEPPLVRVMTRLAPLPGSLFPEVLYVYNRNALLGGLDVRLALDTDAEGVCMLVAGVTDSEETKQLLQAAQERGTAVVAVCQGEVVGLITINPTVDLPLLQINFSLSRLLDLQHHPSQKHGEIDMYTMNPIFAHRHREFLVAAQHLLKRTCLYYALPPGQPAPSMLGCMMQVLVVGASECGLSTIETLLLSTTHAFNYVTLLAPGGISVGGVACEFTASVISKMGLEACVTLLDAEMVGLDRQQQLVELNDGSKQEQTRNDLAEFDPEAAGAVMNVTELASDFSLADSKTMSAISIYGDTLDAYHALAILEKRGGAGMSEFSAPPGEEQPAVAIMKDLAKRMEFTVPDPKPSELSKLESIPGDLRPKAVFSTHSWETGESEEESSVIDLMVGCRAPDVSKTIFYCLNDTGIVYDGRVVVDNRFRTNDPNIYAGGSLSKLSRKFSSTVQYEHYNSCEVGQRLAESVVASFSATADDGKLPNLTKAKSIGCNIPGGMVFVMSGTPAAMQSPSVEPPEGGKMLGTQTARGVFHVNLDASSRVHSILYFGHHSLQVLKLASLVGVHTSYLNHLVPRYEAGEIEDLVEYFAQPWAELLFHDHFSSFRAVLLGTGTQLHAGVGLDKATVRSDTQDAALEFIRAHIGELNMYNLPQTA